MTIYCISVDGKTKQISRRRFDRLLNKLRRQGVPETSFVYDDGLVHVFAFTHKGKHIELIAGAC